MGNPDHGQPSQLPEENISARPWTQNLINLTLKVRLKNENFFRKGAYFLAYRIYSLLISLPIESIIAVINLRHDIQK